MSHTTPTNISELKSNIATEIKSPASPKISGAILQTDLNDMIDVLSANSRITTGLYTCSTAAATATKAVTIPDYVMEAGGAFKVKFTYANSAANPVLKINTENSHAIVFNGAVASATNTWGAGEVVEFYYDPTYNSNAGGFIGKSTVVSVSQNTLSIGGTEVGELGGQNIDNSKYLYVITDSNQQVLFGITKNGDFEFGAGVPTQIINLIDANRDAILLLLEDKVDKVAGKGLSSNDFTDAEKVTLSSLSIVSNGEWLFAITDSLSQILFGIKRDYTTFIAELQDPSGYIGEPDTTDSFTVMVNSIITLQSDDDNAQAMLDSQDMMADDCKIMLPHNYDKKGKPVPLMICPHGGGGTCNDITTSTLSRYFCANGFAVCDCNGAPYDYRSSKSVGTSHCANPMAMECYSKLYQYVRHNYNVQEFVTLVGGSMGGMTSIQLALLGNIPIKAIGVFCPVTDLYNQAFLNPWGVGVKRSIGLAFGLTHIGTGIDDNFEWDAEKVIGYNPMTNGMISIADDGTIVPSEGDYDFSTHTLNGAIVKEYHKWHYPIKIWHCKDDTTVNYACSERFVNAIRNYGGPAILRPLATGGHGPTNMGGQVANPVGNNNFRGTVLDIRGVSEEIYLWINRFVKH